MTTRDYDYFLDRGFFTELDAEQSSEAARDGVLSMTNAWDAMIVLPEVNTDVLSMFLGVPVHESKTMPQDRIALVAETECGTRIYMPQFVIDELVETENGFTIKGHPEPVYTPPTKLGRWARFRRWLRRLVGKR